MEETQDDALINVAAKQSLKLNISFKFADSFEFDLMKCKESSDIFEAFQKSTTSYFSTQFLQHNNSVEAIMVGDEDPSSKTHVIEFIIQSIGKENNLENYRNIKKSKKGKKLWNFLEKELQKALPDREIHLSSWDDGSIIINVAIRKSSGQNWEESELQDIEEKLPSFEKIVENRLPGVRCQCEMRRKTTEDLRTSLAFRFDTISADLARQMDVFDEDIFMIFLEYFLTQIEQSKPKGKIISQGITVPFHLKKMHSIFYE